MHLDICRPPAPAQNSTVYLVQIGLLFPRQFSHHGFQIVLIGLDLMLDNILLSHVVLLNCMTFTRYHDGMRLCDIDLALGE